jgi:hypothetical protein
MARAAPGPHPAQRSSRRVGAHGPPAAYDEQSKKLVGLFSNNFVRFAGQVSDAVRRAGPHR